MAHRAVRWPVWIATRLLLPLVLLAAIFTGILYVRLANGSLPLKPLASPIARAIAAGLPGIDVALEDVAAVLTEDRGFELRLGNIRFLSASGATIAEARSAAVSLSGNALWSGQIAPSRIVLIEPRLTVVQSRTGGISLSVSRGEERDQPPSRLPSDTAIAVAPPPDEAAQSLGVAAEISAALDRIGRQVGASGFIKRVGLRNATLVIQSEHRQSTWRIREADFGFERAREGSMFAADVEIDSGRTPWKLALVARRNDATRGLTVEARFADLQPSDIATSLPSLAALSALEIPVKGDAAISITPDGAIEAAALTLDLGRGAIAPGWRGGGKLPVDAGRLKITYDPAARRLSLEPSRVGSGASWATLAGSLTHGADTAAPWQIELYASEGMFAAEEFRIAAKPLEAFRVRATREPSTGTITVTEAVVGAAGGRISLTARIPGSGDSSKLVVNGQMSPMPVETLKLLWPSPVAPGARSWSGNQILQGRLVSGSFLIEDIGHGADRGRAASADGQRIAVSIEGAGVRILPKPGFSPVEAPKVLVRLEGNTLDVSAPEAVIATTPQRRLPLRGVRMVASDVTAANAFGELTLRAQGPLQPALDLAEQQAARRGRSLSLPGEGLEGRVDGQVRISVPLGDALTADDTRLEIKGRITEGKGKGVLGGYDIAGATITLDLTDQSLDAKGDMLVAGVPAKLNLKRIFAADDGDQPPILLTANLDSADRTQLGLDINDFIQGEMPVEILVSPRPQGEPTIQLRANLTAAELQIEPLAWKKAPGRRATLQFDIARPSKTRTELQNLRIVGEDISLSGTLVLDGRNKAREFTINELALHVVSRLQLSGNLRNDNIWDVTVRGQTLDGRDFFTSLFSVSSAASQSRDKAAAAAAAARKDHSGLDLKANIDTVLGHQDLSLKSLNLAMSNRNGRTVSLTARGIVDGPGKDAGKPLDVTIQQATRDGPRRLVARTDDAGQTFRLIGFYPSMQSGRMQLDVNLDGSGAAEKTGRLVVERFAILGDPVAVETASSVDGGRAQRRVERPRLDFDSMVAPFELGQGQLIIKDADVRGQAVGVLLRGKADFRQQFVDLGGTYVPLQGLNSAVGNFPILGQILAGPRGEGVIGMTFAIQGPMSRPQVIVNPASIVPGFLRDMFQMTNPNPRITPRDTPAPTPPPARSAPARIQTPAKSPPPPPRSVTPRIEADGGWNSQTVNPPAPQPARRQ